MAPEASRERDADEEEDRRRRILIAVVVGIVAAIAIGIGMMALVVAVVPNDFVDSSFVNHTDTSAVIYVNGEAVAVAGVGATVSNFGLFPRDGAEAAPRYIVQAYKLESERDQCTGPSDCAGKLIHCVIYAWDELSALDWMVQVDDNVAGGQRFGEITLDSCP